MFLSFRADRSWANNVAVWSGSTLFAILSAPSIVEPPCSNFRELLEFKLDLDLEQPRGGISGTNLVQMCRWASLYPPYKCILENWKSIPINVYPIIGDNNKYSLFPLRLGSFMQTITSSVKYWIISWFLSENNKITLRDKSQVVRLSTAGD